MSDAGAPAEAIALAVEAIEAMQVSLDARRTADRDRKRAQRARRKSANVAGQSEDNPETVTPMGSLEVSPLASPLPKTSELGPLNPPSEGEEAEADLALKPEHLQEAWNDGPAARGAVTCRRMGPDRRRKSISFLRRYPVEDITEAIAAVHRSDFLCGVSKDGFRADIDFLFVSKHMDRLLEGFYAR